MVIDNNGEHIIESYEELKSGGQVKIKPILFNTIKTSHTSFAVDFKIDYNITFIVGDSGVGKSAVFSFMQEMAAENKSIRCYNYLDKSKGYKGAIKKLKDKLIVIDNADILLDNALRAYISLDDKNQYIIIGRNPTGLLLQYDEMYELENHKEGDITIFSLKNCSI